MEKNRSIEYGIAILFLMLIIGNVSAFAVSSPYFKDNPLVVAPGETKDFQLVLQNSAGGENVTVKGSVTTGSEIISLTDASDIYEVILGSSKNVNLRVSVPADATDGKVYPVEVTFLSAGAQGGTLGFGSGVGQKFDVVVQVPKVAPPVAEPIATQPTQEEPSNSGMTILIVALVIIVLAIIVLVYFKFKKRK